MQFLGRIHKQQEAASSVNVHPYTIYIYIISRKASRWAWLSPNEVSNTGSRRAARIQKVVKMYVLGGLGDASDANDTE